MASCQSFYAIFIAFKNVAFDRRGFFDSAYFVCLTRYLSGQSDPAIRYFAAGNPAFGSKRKRDRKIFYRYADTVPFANHLSGGGFKRRAG